VWEAAVLSRHWTVHSHSVNVAYSSWREYLRAEATPRAVRTPLSPASNWLRCAVSEWVQCVKPQTNNVRGYSHIDTKYTFEAAWHHELPCNSSTMSELDRSWFTMSSPHCTGCICFDTNVSLLLLLLLLLLTAHSQKSLQYKFRKIYHLCSLNF
jgi:hypothetical protein